MSTAANTLPATASPVESAVLRAVLGNFCTGVTVITAHDGAQPRGFACQSVTSLSLDPPYVSFCPAGTSTSWPAMREAGRTCVNVLAADQRDVCGRFASTGGDKFAGLEWGYGGNGAPTLPGAIARIEADLEVEHQAGDHTIAICRVTSLEAERAVDPLLYFRGSFGHFAGAL